MERIVTVQPGLLRRPIDMEQEYAVEQIQHFVLIAGDAADEHRPVLPGQDLLRPAAAPHPAMRPAGAGGPELRSVMALVRLAAGRASSCLQDGPGSGRGYHLTCLRCGPGRWRQAGLPPGGDSVDHRR